MAFDPISIAIYIALTVASIFLQRQNVEQGKLDDISVDTGSYNRIIPRVYGTQMVVPQTIWIANNELIEIKKKKSILWGIGGSVTTYSYFATFAVAATNNKVKLRKIYANDKLVYDTTDVTNSGWSDEIYEAINKVKKKFGRVFEFEYKDGSTDQSISSILSKVDGVAETTAYRGISYLAVQFFPLEDFGNSIPQFKFEVVEVDDTTFQTLPLTFPHGMNAWPGLDNLGRLIVQSGDTVSKINPLTNVEEEHIPAITDVDLSAPFSTSPSFYENTNSVIAPLTTIILAPESIAGDAVMLDMGSGKVIGFAQDGSGLIPYSNATLKNEYWMSSTGEIISYFNMANMLAMGGAPILQTWNLNSLVTDGEIQLNLICPSTSTTRWANVYWGVIGPDPGNKLYLHDVGEFNLSTLYGYSTRPSIGWSTEENAFIIVGDAGIVKLDHLGNELAHNTRACNVNMMATRLLTQFDYTKIWLVTGDNKFILVNLRTLEIEREFDNADVGVFGGITDVITLAKTNAFVVDVGVAGGSLWTTVFYDIADQENTTVRHVIEDLANEIDFPAARLDASAGIQEISGLTVGGDNARGPIDDLIRLTNYDLIQEDGKLKVIPRGNTPVVAIDYDDLGTNSGKGEKYRIERSIVHESEIPQKVELSFADIDGEFESNLAIARSPRNGIKTPVTISVDTPIALDVDTAKTFAHRILSESQRERSTVSFKIPFKKYPRLSVGDVVTVPDEGDDLNVKITRLSGKHSITVQAVIDDPTGNDTILTGTSRGVPVSQLPSVGQAGAVVIDSSLPNDNVDFLDGYGINSFSIPKGRTVGEVDFIRSIDEGIVYEPFNVNEGDPQVDLATGLLFAIANPYLIDNVSSLIMKFTEVPASVTQDQLLVNDDLNVLFIQTDGLDWEIVQFTTVTDNLDGTHTLTGLMRGLRGTEHLIGSHTSPFLVVLKNDAYIRGGDITHETIEGRYAAIKSEDETDPYFSIFTPVIEGLKPYSVAHLAVEVTAIDSEISWIRRTRIGGATLDGTDVPLSETSEKYDIEIYDMTPTLVRTVSGHTTESYNYINADQLTDLGAAWTAHTIKVYQVSDEIGRGHVSELYNQNMNPSRLATTSKLGALVLKDIGKSTGTVSKVSVLVLRD